MDRRELTLKARAWLEADPDAATREELTRVLESGDLAELSDRFASALEFGTAGLRGVLGAGPNRMNRAVVRRTTLGLANYLRAHVPDLSTRGVVVGRDGRRLSRELAEDTAAVFAAQGVPVHVFDDVVPTPLTAFAALHLKAAAAVMVTASHNPPEYNGYKVYWGNGAQIIPPHDAGIARAIDAVGPAREVPLLAEGPARAQQLVRTIPPQVERSYLDAIHAQRRHPEGPKDFPVVYTALHGVGGRLAVQALREAGFARVHPVTAQHQPDGTFPTVRFPNPEEPGAMDLAQALAQEVGARLILANDPDADRLAVTVRDAQGALRALNGNEIGVLLGHYALTHAPATPRPLLVTTIVSSPQLGRIAQDLGARYEETLTGFKWIANRALECERAEGARFVFGYEEALGYSVGTVVRDKDGIGAALVFADLASWVLGRGQTVLGYLEEIHRAHGLFVADQKNFTFPGPGGAGVIAAILEGFRRSPPARIGELAVRAVKDYQSGELPLPPSNVIAYELDGGSRITLRPSGTEPKVKYYFDLKEDLRAGEDVAGARARAKVRLTALQAAFLTLARERGQP